MALDLWGRERVVEPPKKKLRRKEVQPIRRPVYCSENNDIDGWFRSNKPETLAECDDLHKALRLKKRVRNYDASVHIAGTGRKLTMVKGPNGNVVIVSKKARAHFNKRLRNRQIYLEVIASQFGTTQSQRAE